MSNTEVVRYRHKSPHSVNFPSVSGVKHPLSGRTMTPLFYLMTMRWLHGLLNYKDTKTKWCHKKLTRKGTLRQVLLKFKDWRNSQSYVGIFDPDLWAIAPRTFSLVHLPHPPLPLKGIVQPKKRVPFESLCPLSVSKKASSIVYQVKKNQLIPLLTPLFLAGQYLQPCVKVQ